jgi:murein DD-endopeptidase MepM/ murein hydrolase activator NlpD
MPGAIMSDTFEAATGPTPNALPSRAGRPRGRSTRSAALGVAAFFAMSLLWSDAPTIPVQGATPADWHPRSFWHYPWGASGVHKSIDIFAPEGRPVLAATSGLVVRSGVYGAGGTMVAVLGPRWRIHYYAHLSWSDVRSGDWVWRGERIGAVGTTGNAAGKPPHLHYVIATLVPYPWRITGEPQGWRKMFFLDPGAALTLAPGRD